MASLVRPLPTELTSATPFERCRIGVPGAGSGLQPVDQFRLVSGRLTCQCTVGQNPLDGLGHVRPGSAEWVYSGMMPCSNNHTTRRCERCPVRLSMTNSN